MKLKNKSNSVGAEYAAPTGLGFRLGWVCYKDVAPTARGGGAGKFLRGEGENPPRGLGRRENNRPAAQRNRFDNDLQPAQSKNQNMDRPQIFNPLNS